MRRFVFDIETDGLGTPSKPPVEVLAGWHDGVVTKAYWGEGCTTEAIADLLSGDYGDHVQVWAHFGGGFDYRFGLQWLIRHVGEMKWLTVGSNILSISGKRPTAVEGETTTGIKFQLNDSIRLLPDGLDKIGKALGYEKLPMKYEHDEECVHSIDKHKWCVACLAADNTYGKGHLEKYWERDLVILWKGIERAEQMLAKVGITKMALTLAANCANAMVARAGRPSTPWDDPKVYRETGIHEPDIDKEAEEAYFGGRVEVFREHAEDVKVYDIRSSYPAAMVMGPLPWTYKQSGTKRWRVDTLGVVTARVRVPEDIDIPLLPFRGKDKLYFPTGEWNGTFTNIELARAMEVGAAEVTAVYHWHEWTGTYAIGELMLEAWEQRAKTTDLFEQYFWKIFMNSGYGKFIEAREKQSVVVNPSTRSLLSQGLKPCRDGMPIYTAERYYQPKVRCAAAGAYVTARARLRLWDYLQQVPRGHLRGALYCDTDSVVVSGCDMPTGDGLGELKHEASYEEGRFWAAKVYALRNASEWRVKAKGLPKIDYDALTALLDGGSYAFERTLGAREMYRSGDIGYGRKRVVKHHLGGRAKRCMLPDGGSRPWTVRELSVKSKRRAA